VLIAGVRLHAGAEEPRKAEDKKVEKKAEPKKADKKPEPKKDKKALPAFPGMEWRLRNLPPGVTAEQLKEMVKRMEEMRKRMEGVARALEGVRGPMMPGMAWGRMGGMGGMGLGRGNLPEPRLGASVAVPGATLVDQLDLPKGQGMVLKEIAPNSAAAKAGLKAHDILLEVDGKAVSSKPEEFVKQLYKIKTGKAVNVVVLRKGKKETIKGVKLPEARKLPELPGRAGFPALPRFPGGAAPRFPALPGFDALPKGAPGGIFVAPGGRIVALGLKRNGNEFTATETSGKSSITVKGEVKDGKARVSEVQVRDGEKTSTYKSVDKVPAAHKASIERLLKLSEGSKVRVRSE
jgi:membrane-associated protease RseP (regulator of RpoE activity)